MKIYINTITPEQVANTQEVLAKEGSKEEFSGTITIGGELFIPGEWKHVPDTFVVDQTAYPFIKEAQVVLEERTSQVLKENGLDVFAQGLKEAAETYKQDVPTIATDAAKLAAVEVTAISVEDIKTGLASVTKEEKIG